jgi:hypothetical protein
MYSQYLPLDAAEDTEMKSRVKLLEKKSSGTGRRHG